MIKKGPLKLGVYGGTFDPVHHAHLILARDALEQLKLDAVLFVPCRQSPHKPGTPPRASEAQRVAMLKQALRGEPRFWLSRCELDRPAPSFAIDTVAEIQDAFPRAKLWWFIGADQLELLATWHRYAELRRAAQFLLLARGEKTSAKNRAAVTSLPRPRRVDISATEVRHRVKSSLPIDHLVPGTVAAYIRRRRLYLP